MKKKVLLLTVLALVVCSTTGIAQEKEYQVGNDGYEWYKVKRIDNGQTKYGAEDRYGNMIVPIEYDAISYIWVEPTGFLSKKESFWAWYNKSGKCIIPYTREYTEIIKWDENEFGTFYTFLKRYGGGICDRNGREVVSVKADGLSSISISSYKEAGVNGRVRYEINFRVKKNGEEYYGFADAKGNIILPAEHKDYISARSLATNRFSTTNPLANNRHETLAEAEGRPQGGQSNPIAGQQQQDGGNTPVVVEHHRDPIPVQEWQQCPACYGSGQCPYVKCGGSGWYYIGDRATTCSRCHGSGKCTICAGRGGQNVTVYR